MSSSQRGWLAKVNLESGPQVGKFRVNLEGLEAIGAGAIIQAVKNCDVATIDEIGPMELFSRKFKEAVVAALESRKLVLAVVHWGASDRLVVDVRSREDSEMFVGTNENWERLVETIAARALEYLAQF